MSDASSIRKSSTLSASTDPGATFYKSAIRFYDNTAFVNTGSQWAATSDVTIAVPIAVAAEDVNRNIFIADRAYKVISVSEVHAVASGNATATAHAVLGDGGATPIDRVDSIVVDSGGTGYSAGGAGATFTIAAPTGTAPLVQATVGTVTVSSGIITAIAVNNAGDGYAGGSGASIALTISGGNGTTVDVVKCTGTTAPSSGLTVLSAPFNDNGAANTTQAGTITANGHEVLAAGDRLALNLSGSVLAYAGGTVSVVLRPV